MKTAVLLKDNIIKKHIPKTCRLSSENLQRLLEKYGMVYIKPDGGRHGRGVMKAEVLSGGEKTGFRLYFGIEMRKYATYEELLAAVERLAASRAYIVQQGIQMLTHDNRPFDVRILVQQFPRRKWKATGYLARVAAPNRIVTNFNNSGTPMELISVLEHHMTTPEAKIYVDRLCQLGEEVSRHCQRSFPNLIRLGLDVAIDRNKVPWILEINTLPQAESFRKLEDKTMLRRIHWYARSYGRYYLRTKRV